MDAFLDLSEYIAQCDMAETVEVSENVPRNEDTRSRPSTICTIA
ncbi:fungal mating-type pheromone [Coprinopsis cinerea okayama7|uniref:Fungal mating-type pheromone n=1 Tax=Coprinopsis cinerea (strain Okayama-7 / 130 / ATCC MYA-4618 / FGSC 9003) TaxID=240176 RepID=D6RQ16_COPC7|nr:fungal mating-type pheromone [Coprinopsis cinerea okayama7\|eukprot:XP_002910430.1 fungal mating-type pheromone [Coprinopsis cinerea okayama7\